MTEFWPWMADVFEVATPRLDGLSLVFLVPMLVVTAAAALYAPRYLAQERYREESVLRYWAFYLLFAVGMAGALAAADLVAFIVAWELMTLASYVLVVHETREAECLRAGMKYFVMTHVGTACLLIAAVLLYAESGSWRFEAIAPAMAALAAHSPVTLHLVLGLLFLGFATKGGLYPFGDWLPDAHPAAPAPVSAVLSGIMVKLGLYGFLRFFVEMLAGAAPGEAVVWGWILGGFGLLSALLGGLAATGARDVKVLLAYSSIAQSGLIALGIGASLVLAPAHPVLASLALLGAVFHIVGDAVVKGLLFLNAGTAQWRMGSRRLDELGGLFDAMPATGWTALIATLGIAGFPPLTAFIGKWMMLQATVLSGVPAVTAAGLGLLMASLLSVLYATKFFAGAFLNRAERLPRQEAPGSMVAAQVGLAACAVAMGLMPGVVIGWLMQAVGSLAPMAGAPEAMSAAWRVGPLSGALAPVVLVIAGLWVALLARSALGGGTAPAERRVWACGLPGGAAPPDPDGFFAPIRDAMTRVYRRLHWPLHAPAPWVPAATDADRWFYRPALRVGRGFSEALRRAHTGVPHVYLAWQLLGALAIVTLLLVLLSR